MKTFIKKASVLFGLVGGLASATLILSCGLLDELKGDLELEIDLDGTKVSFVYDENGNTIPVTTNGRVIFNALLDTELTYTVNDGSQRTHTLEGRAEVIELEDVGEPTEKGTLYEVDVTASFDDSSLDATFTFIVSRSGFAFDQLSVKGTGPDGEFALESDHFGINWSNGNVQVGGSATFKLRASSNMNMNFELFAGQGNEIARDATPDFVSGDDDTNINVVGLTGSVNGKPVQVTLDFPVNFRDTIQDGDPYTLRMTAMKGSGDSATTIVREVVYTHDVGN